MVNCPYCNNKLSPKRLLDHGIVADCGRCKKMFILTLVEVTDQMLVDYNITDKMIPNDKEIDEKVDQVPDPEEKSEMP